MAAKLDYEKSKEYWGKIQPTMDGMLGGYSLISDRDIGDSADFLCQLRQRIHDAPSLGRALDVGAGIGRVTRYLLANHHKKVDLLEQNEQFLNTAKKSLQTYPFEKPNVDNYFHSGLMDFTNPDGITYDIIWIQWVLPYLNDEDVVEFLKRCLTWLNPRGVIVVKENISQIKDGEEDFEDSSITRSYDQYMELFKQANLKCIIQEKQKHFPKELYKVFMFALRHENL